MFEISNETKNMQFAIKIKTTLQRFNSAFVAICLSHLQLIFERLFVFRLSTSALILFSVLSSFFNLRINPSFVLRIRLSFDFLISSFFLPSNQYSSRSLKSSDSSNKFLFRSSNSSNSFSLRSLNSLSSFFFPSLRMFSFHSASVMFQVAISRISNKKRRVEFLNMFESVNFFRDAKMSENDVKMKYVKKNINLCNMKNLNQIEINFFK